MRGSRDGFVETLVFNTALIRRRIRDPKLRMEIMNIGESSHTDIAICYMENRVDTELLNRIRNRIQKVHVDALSMNQESLAECIYPHKWFNPFPKFRFSERPDTSAASILEGNIIILVDNSPSAMILPSSVFDIIEEADDYYFPPLTGTYLRLSRTVIFFLTLFLTPLWLLFMQNPGRALSREDILTTVWGRDYDGELKIVDVNIRRLRIKIEDDTANPVYITTVWGFGYKWGV